MTSKANGLLLSTEEGGKANDEAFNDAQRDADALMNAIFGSLDSLRRQHETLREAYADLRREHDELQDRYVSDKANWRAFREWWQVKMAEKRSGNGATPVSRTTPTSDKASVALRAVGRTTPSTPDPCVTPLTSRHRARRSDADSAMLQCVGLAVKAEEEDVDGMGIPTPSRGPQLASPFPSERAGTSVKASKRSKLSSEVDLHSSSVGDSSLKSDGAKRSVLQERTNRPSPSRLAPGSKRMKGQNGEPSKPATNGSSAEKTLTKTINAEFEVDPTKNGDRPYLFKDVVRDKAKRKQMHAHDCECCRDWYDAVGPVAVRPFEDVRADDEADDIDAVQRQRQEHVQRTSRHRTYGPPPPTPPGYWEIGFPTTQRVQELNRTAQDAHNSRRNGIARDPRFRRRNER